MGSAHVGWAFWIIVSALLRPERSGTRSSVIDARPYATADDSELMAWSATGDRRAFDAIVVRHGPMALRVARRMVDDPVIAEDVVQEAMVRVWQQAGRFDAGRARLTTWLYRIVVNLVIDQQRRARDASLPEDFDAVDPSPGAETGLVAAEDHAALRSALAMLRPDHRLVVVLVYGEGLSGAETARRLGLTAKAVERILSRAREALRSSLSGWRGSGTP